VNAGQVAAWLRPLPTPSPSLRRRCSPIMISGGISNSDPTQIDLFEDFTVAQICDGGQPTLPNLWRRDCPVIIINTPSRKRPDRINASMLMSLRVARTALNRGQLCIWAASIPGESAITGSRTRASSPVQKANSRSYAFPGQTYVFVVSEVDPGQGCPSYTMTITGLCPPRDANANSDGYSYTYCNSHCAAYTDAQDHSNTAA